MRKIVVLGLILVLSACSGWGKKELGLSNRAPDETLVEQRQPLSVPPEFNVRPNIKVDVDE